MAKMIILFIISLAGALMNIVINVLGIKLEIPLFLDTIMTVSVTLLCGLPWGALCGALSNIIGHSLWFWGWEGYLFALCNIATAWITWMFIRFFPKELNLIPGGLLQEQVEYVRSSRLSWIMDRIIALILLSFALCIGMSVLGGLISVFIQIINPAHINEPGRYALLGRTLFDENSPAVVVEILSRIPVNIVDRLIASFAGYGIAIGLNRGLRSRIFSMIRVSSAR
ncbi:MAG: hypothetical protein LBH42_00340 [Treponema sp.]|jgi:hypothetical protein|nr:hypothetical protein [Treponema sp.]